MNISQYANPILTLNRRLPTIPLFVFTYSLDIARHTPTTTMGKRRSSFVASDDSGDDRPATVSKKVKKGSSSGGPDVDSEGNTFWEVL